MTPRQKKLLHAIIDEFIDSAEAVGSVSLANKYRLGVSPATIRNEMAELVEQGYLEKPHSSSGRVPTNTGFRFFIDRLMQEMESLEYQTQNSVYEDLFQNRFSKDKLIYRAAEFLADKSNNASLIVIGNRIYHAGLYNLVEQPEFHDSEVLKKVIRVLEDYDTLLKIFKLHKGEGKVKILVGPELEGEFFKNIAVIFSTIKLHGNEQGYIAVIGPNRMNYSKIIPVFNFTTDSINRVVSGW